MIMEQITDATLVPGIHETVQQANREAFQFLALQIRNQRLDRLLIERKQDLATGVQAFRNWKTQVTRHQRLRFFQEKVVLLEAAFRAHFEGVPETLRGDQGSASALAFDESVGGERGSMDHQAHIVWRVARQIQHLADACQHTCLWYILLRQHLDCVLLSFHLQHHIGECAANVRADSYFSIHIPKKALRKRSLCWSSAPVPSATMRPVCRT